jgi:hypothetical protein
MASESQINFARNPLPHTRFPAKSIASACRFQILNQRLGNSSRTTDWGCGVEHCASFDRVLIRRLRASPSDFRTAASDCSSGNDPPGGRPVCMHIDQKRAAGCPTTESGIAPNLLPTSAVGPLFSGSPSRHPANLRSPSTKNRRKIGRLPQDLTTNRTHEILLLQLWIVLDTDLISDASSLHRNIYDGNCPDATLHWKIAHNR